MRNNSKIRTIVLIFLFLIGGAAGFSQTVKPFKFALITDTHIGNPNNDEDLYRTVKDINSQSDIDFVIVSGDVTEFGSYDELHTAACLLNELKVPYYALPGNHDSNWSESGTNAFLRLFGSETFGFEHNGYKFIGLASGPNMRMGPGQIPRENLTWFFEELKKTDKNTPLICVNHYPMDNSLNNWFEVMDAYRPYNVQLMLCGHGHNNRAMNFEGAHAVMCRSNLRANQEFGGYNIITVTADSIYFRERIVSGETKEPWIAYSVTERPRWESNPPRPDYSINRNHPFVMEIWSVQEKSDIGSGMYLMGDRLIYTNTSGEIKVADATNGKTVWAYKTGGKVYSTPIVYQNTVWCASSDSYLYGLSVKNGRMQHKLKNDNAVVGSPAVDNEKVMVAGSDGHCRAWNVNTGKPVWQFDSVKNFVVARPQVKDGVLFFGSWGNEFYALDTQTGKSRWIWHNGQSNRMFSPAQVIPVITHSRVYLVSPDRFMTVLNEQTGEVVWRHNDPENRVRESIGISEDGKTVYAKTMDGKILAIDATVPEREIKWISSGEDMGYELAPSPVVEKNGIVYSPTDKGLIYAYRASDGVFLWKYRISNGLINMILPTDNNELYVSAMDGKLMKLKNRD
ncbi:MAG: PQQ-binding-like beta-propeller repeat protein [Petrimonas sp.]|jgi:outer membrane protein assembly factor BamB/predicted phosphodiesterase|uniref:outer membrane protein assembly factor BamB family protein n=1 Tax=Petrimonas sp. TaxID=2023866 RepID=UPI000E933C0B|nr:PQQ-binding-like beta-propeller repeat protein [Petrimonas sp.]MEA4996445.1 PQQ-binding-like beta-propeller repeat protein [Petrimonas sp.]MEA5043598.1 PQQ-binding-like beta-propeller repeat protein [Petrimonas sp.]HBG80842.1 metallophosphoesterase [Porphyromonadaceae bacterium]